MKCYFNLAIGSSRRTLCTSSSFFLQSSLGMADCCRSFAYNVAVSNVGRSYDLPIPRIEAAESLNNFGLSNDDIEVILESGIEFQREALSSRLAYLNFLINVGSCEKSEGRDLLVYQPRFLEQRFGILHEDADYIIFNKPFDTKLNFNKKNVPGFEGERCCITWLTNHLPEMNVHRFCHQLDFATSGILVVGKSQESAGNCARLFRERLAKKEYTAVVYGWPDWETKEISASIDSTDGFSMKVGADGVGKESFTSIKVIHRGILALKGHPRLGEKVSLLHLEPGSGRRHQLRVHCQLLGLPIVGDATYAEDKYSYRMFLHASRLKLPLLHTTYQIYCPSNFDHAIEICPLN